VGKVNINISEVIMKSLGKLPEACYSITPKILFKNFLEGMKA
jgi:hypothetical protein